MSPPLLACEHLHDHMMVYDTVRALFLSTKFNLTRVVARAKTQAEWVLVVLEAPSKVPSRVPTQPRAEYPARKSDAKV